MTELTHALRALASSLKDRAALAISQNRPPVIGAILEEIGGACDDAADSLEHRWRTRNAIATGQERADADT